MATVRVSRDLIHAVSNNVHKLFEAKIKDHDAAQPKHSYTNDQLYSMAMANSNMSPELVAKIPSEFFRRSDGMYVRIIEAKGSDLSKHTEYVRFVDSKGASENRVVSENWTRSYRSTATVVDPKFVQAYKDWETTAQTIKAEVDTATRKVVALLEKCGTANKFIKVYPDGEALLPAWAVTKIKEVVVRTKNGKPAVDVAEEDMAFLTGTMSEVITVGVLDDVI